MAHTYGSECRIQLIRPSDDSNGSFYFGRALGFEVVVSSQRDREGLRFGITVLDMGGAPIFTGFTRELINLANHNENKFHISIPDSQLAPGNYNLALSLFSGGLHQARTILDLVNPAIEFSVMASR